MTEKLVCVGENYIRPSAVVSIEPQLFGGCRVYLSMESGRLMSKQHYVFIDMPAEKIAQTLGIAPAPKDAEVAAS